MDSKLSLNLVPYPKRCTRGSGSMKLQGEIGIFVPQPELKAQVEVLMHEIEEIVCLSCKLTDRQSAQIVLEIDSSKAEEEYSLGVTEKQAVVSGGSFRAVAWGCVTIGQLLEKHAGFATIPCVEIEDFPASDYRGLMVDLARHWNPIEIARQAVMLSRWYKVKYLHLHFVDDPLWTLPSEAYPGLPTPQQHYTGKELLDLEDFANACGVTIIPEIDVPGHAKSLVKGLGDIVGTSNMAEGVISPGRESTYEVLNTLIGESLEIFKSTPYFHIGADEVEMHHWTECAYCKDYMSKHDISSERELYRHFIVRMNDIVKSHGKQTMVWEGFSVAGEIEIPRDILVMEFESHYEHPATLLNAGYKVINTSWKPLYVVNQTNWSPEEIYAWNKYRWEHFWEQSMAFPDGIGVPKDSAVIGAQLCAWEQPADIQISSTRLRLAALSERVWSDCPRSEDFADRSRATDVRLTDIL